MKLSKITKSTFSFLDAKFTIGNLLSGQRSNIMDASTDTQITIEEDENGEYHPVRVIKTSKKIQDEQTVINRVKSWENIEDEEGEPMECTTENKLKLCRSLDPDTFADFLIKLGEESVKLDDSIKVQAEKKTKN
jgi:hypothetical protein